MNDEVAKPFWPELPRSLGDLEAVHHHLLEWAEWAEFDREEFESSHATSGYSIVHIIECALILWLSHYASQKGESSDIFRNSRELEFACSVGVFQVGFPLSMARALITCYSFEDPCGLAPAYAKQYADEITEQLKDIALYQIEPLEGSVNKLGYELSKHRSGRPSGSRAAYKDYVKDLLKEELEMAGDQWLPAKVLRGILCERVPQYDVNVTAPLTYDREDDELIITKTGKSYTVDRFNKDMSEFRAKK